MTPFLKLTEENGRTIYIAVPQIISFAQMKNKLTVVELTKGLRFVQEPPAQIVKMLEKVPDDRRDDSIFGQVFGPSRLRR